MDIIDEVIKEKTPQIVTPTPLELVLTNIVEDITLENNKELRECMQHLDSPKEVLENKIEDPRTLIKEKPILELNPFPFHLTYVFSEGEDEKPAIISSTLCKEEEKRLVEVPKKNKEAFGWKIFYFKGINPYICMHNINLEEDIKLVAQPQRRPTR